MKYIALFLFLCVGSFLFAQDQIFKKDNTKIDAKILEISTTEIKYKLFTYQDGPTIIVNKSEVAMVIYQNGSHEVFNTSSAPQSGQQPAVINYDEYRAQLQAQHDSLEKQRTDRQKQLFAELTSTKNLVMVNLLESMNGGIGFCYLREFANNNLNLYVPVSFGFAPPGFTNSTLIERYSKDNISDYHFTQKTVEVGLGVNYQASNTRRVTYFVGPLVSMAQYNGDFVKTSYSGYPYTTTQHGFVMNRYSFCINNGVLFRITKHFDFMINAAFGYHDDTFIANDPAKYANPGYNSYSYAAISYPFNTFKAGVNFGYRF